jgi:hypothetical protein
LAQALGSAGQVGAGLGAIVQLIGDPEPYRDAQALCDLVAVEQLEHMQVGGVIDLHRGP